MLRWLEFTERRAVLVVSTDGFILWSRSSAAALKTGAYFRTSRGPMEIPAESLAARQDLLGINHGPGVWFNKPVHEMTIFAEQYDFTLSLLLLQNDTSAFGEDPVPNIFDRMTSR